LLIVVLLVSILAQAVITNSTAGIYDQLVAAANIISGELAYARSLAVGNNGTYCFDIDTSNNRLVMHYTGGDPTLNILPSSPFRSPTDPSDKYYVGLANFPRLGSPVTLLGAQSVGSSTQTITSVEFGPYGATTQANQSLVWLTAGSASSRRFICVAVNPVTGLATVGAFGATAPTGLTVPSP
jgi:Tfp pilus assembly protein FimT